MFALYQAIHPNRWISDLADGGTYTIVTNSIDSQWTPLEPFFSDSQDDFYSSSSARHTTTFGYTYPEIDDWSQNSAQLAKNVTAQVNNLYNPGNQFTRRSLTDKRALLPGQQTVEWSVALNVSKFDLNGECYIVRIFVGDVPASTEDWPTANAGSFTVFAPPHNMTGPYPKVMAYSEVSLVQALEKNGVDCTEVEAVAKYLTSALAWKVQMVCLSLHFLSS